MKNWSQSYIGPKSNGVRENEGEMLVICGLGALLLVQNRAVRKRRWWVRSWATEEQRQNQGIANYLVGELRLTDPGSFQNFNITIISIGLIF